MTIDAAPWSCPDCQVPLQAEGAGHRCRRCGQAWAERQGIWQGPRRPAPAGFDAVAAGRLAGLDERRHFWARERRRLLARLIARRVRPERGRVLELGCGTGAMLPFFASHFREVVAVDGHEPLLLKARSAAADVSLIEADVIAPPLAPASFDLVAAFDVIEHVDPDALLATARRLVRPDGRLLLSAPAFPSLWSAMDELAGHRCRYRLSMLRRELARNGWRLAGHTHYQCLLFPAMLLSRKLSGGTPDSLERSPPAWLDHLLGTVNRLEAGLLGSLSLPFGSSLIAWATPT